VAKYRRPLDESKSLHELKRDVNTLTFMGEHCQQLLCFLDQAIKTTYDLAPVRKPRRNQDDLYRFCRSANEGQLHPDGNEDRLNRAIWIQYGCCAGGKKEFLLGICRCILSREVPLYSDSKDSGWGEIDLVGVSSKGTPVVVELKPAESKDTPLKMLIQAASYGVALRKAWNDDSRHLASEWCRAVSVPASSASECLFDVPLVCLAPAGYWARRIGQRGKHTNGKVPTEAWPVFHHLVKAFAAHGLPASFWEFDCKGPEGLDIRNIRPVVLPWRCDDIP
jgi:Holliday junction resolvase-like predicted endonuclease